jgi:putative membrane protein
MMYGWGYQGWGIGMWVFMAVAMVIFWAIVVFGIVALVRTFGHTHETPSVAPAGPEGILRERFARGEIDEEEFRKTLVALREK